jgi:hypothetical protein
MTYLAVSSHNHTPNTWLITAVYSWSSDKTIFTAILSAVGLRMANILLARFWFDTRVPPSQVDVMYFYLIALEN